MQPRRRRSTAFVADAMLGSLARKLRALGFDTSYYREGDDEGIICAAARERRLILTSDASLAQRAKARKVEVFLLTGRTDGIRLASLVAQARSSGVRLVRGDSLCSVCGGMLESITRAGVSGKVPPSVVRRHRFFRRCMTCGRYYWRGSHWKKLRWLERILAHSDASLTGGREGCGPARPGHPR